MWKDARHLAMREEMGDGGSLVGGGRRRLIAYREGRIAPRGEEVQSRPSSNSPRSVISRNVRPRSENESAMSDQSTQQVAESPSIEPACVPGSHDNGDSEKTESHRRRNTGVVSDHQREEENPRYTANREVELLPGAENMNRRRNAVLQPEQTTLEAIIAVDNRPPNEKIDATGAESNPPTRRTLPDFSEPKTLGVELIAVDIAILWARAGNPVNWRMCIPRMII